mgnify:CR=1 FL=1
MKVEISYDKIETFDGKKVKINADKILTRKLSVSERFRKFVLKNRDKIFTAVDSKKGTAFTGIMYELAEDDTPVKWLFYADDLIVEE